MVRWRDGLRKRLLVAAGLQMADVFEFGGGRALLAAGRAGAAELRLELLAADLAGAVGAAAGEAALAGFPGGEFGDGHIRQ